MSVIVSDKDFSELAAFIEEEAGLAVWDSGGSLYAYRSPCHSSSLEEWEDDGKCPDGEPRGLVLDLPYLAEPQASASRCGRAFIDHDKWQIVGVEAALVEALEQIASVRANSNSEPDEMGDALADIKEIAAAALALVKA